MKKIISITILILAHAIVFTNAQNISNINASFCNPNQSEREIDLVTKADTNTDICIVFQNNSTQDTSISIDFTDGAITPQGDKACLSAEKPQTNFGQYIQDYTKTLIISGSNTIQKHFKIKYPVGFSGLSHGCLGYSINNKNNIGGGIGLVFRKVHTIDILVGGTEINSDITFRNISISGDTATNRIILDIQNKGNIDQEIQLSGTISNILGFKQNFDTYKFILSANTGTYIVIDNINLPDYKGLFKIQTNIQYTPKFNFDITNHNISNKYITPGTILVTKSIMIRNWFYIISLSIISILLIIIIQKYIKK